MNVHSCGKRIIEPNSHGHYLAYHETHPPTEYDASTSLNQNYNQIITNHHHHHHQQPTTLTTTLSSSSATNLNSQNDHLLHHSTYTNVILLPNNDSGGDGDGVINDDCLETNTLVETFPQTYILSSSSSSSAVDDEYSGQNDIIYQEHHLHHHYPITIETHQHQEHHEQQQLFHHHQQQQHGEISQAQYYNHIQHDDHQHQQHHNLHHQSHNHHHHPSNLEEVNYHEPGSVINNNSMAITTTTASSYIETVVGNEATEVIIQDCNGQYYRQIQNVYVSAENRTDAIEIVPMTEHGYEQLEAYEPVYQLEQVPNVSAAATDAIDDGNNNNEHNIISNNTTQFDGLVLLSSNIIDGDHHHHHHHHQQQNLDHHHHHLPEGLDTDDSIYTTTNHHYTLPIRTSPNRLLEIGNENQIQPEPVSPQSAQMPPPSVPPPLPPSSLQSQGQPQRHQQSTTHLPAPSYPTHRNLLLESTMSPLLAAVNDITARDEELQSYFIQNDMKENEQRNNHQLLDHHHQNHQYIPTTETFLLPTEDNNHHQQQQQSTNPNSIIMENTTNELKITNVYSVASEYVDINDMDFIAEHRNRQNPNSNYVNQYHHYRNADHNNSGENQLLRRSQRRLKQNEELTVSDKKVQCRAFASCPTSYLCIEKCQKNKTDDNFVDFLGDDYVFTKKDILLNTKFGPIEGDIKFLTPNEILEIKSKKSQRLPLLFVNNTNVIDVSNEYTSNWMRYVRLANTFNEQNLLLYELDKKLYFKSCQKIKPKTQLRVGYSKSYADHYGLTFLEPPQPILSSSSSQQSLSSSSSSTTVPLSSNSGSGVHQWHCYDCNKNFTSCGMLEKHLNIYHINNISGFIDGNDEKQSNTNNNVITKPVGIGRRKRRLVRTKLSTRKVSGPTVRYACCYCSRVFSKAISFKRHNEYAHSFHNDGNDIRSALLNRSNGAGSGGGGGSGFGVGLGGATINNITTDYFHNKDINSSSNNDGINCYITNSIGLTSDNGSNKENTTKSQSNNKCEQCRRYFSSTERLAKHRVLHGSSMASKWVQCTYCPKKLMTQSALAMHVKSHIFKSRLFACLYCSDRFQHANELMGHVQQHMENGLYNCNKCNKKYKDYATVRKHVRATHLNAVHTCPDCGRDFKSRHKLKRHRLTHTNIREFLCSDCGKQFNRKDKLREHIRLVHSKIKKKKLPKKPKKIPPSAENNTNINNSKNTNKSKKKQNCELKTITNVSTSKIPKNKENNNNSTNLLKRRKVEKTKIPQKISKLSPESTPLTFLSAPKTNLKSLPLQPPHVLLPSQSQPSPSPHPPPQLIQPTPPSPSPSPLPLSPPPPSPHQSSPHSLKVPPIDYERFIYKCHDCRLGFKRRGMLVNHLAKCHPTVSIDSVPELNLPILKAVRYFCCQHCDKIYKSSSKRKAHILKYHPGLELPQSSRQKFTEIPGQPNPTYSETVGNVTVHPQRCLWCHKQYASKARLLQHQRKLHSKQLELCCPQLDVDLVTNAACLGGEMVVDDGELHDDELNMETVIQQQQQQQQQIQEQHYSHEYSTKDQTFPLPPSELLPQPSLLPPTLSQQQTQSQPPLPPPIYPSETHHQFFGFETENKLLKLSSAALEASLKDDFYFFDNDEDGGKIITNNQQDSIDHHQHPHHNMVDQSTTTIMTSNANKDDGNGISSDGGRNNVSGLSQLFDDMDYISDKGLVATSAASTTAPSLPPPPSSSINCTSQLVHQQSQNQHSQQQQQQHHHLHQHQHLHHHHQNHQQYFMSGKKQNYLYNDEQQ